MVQRIRRRVVVRGRVQGVFFRDSTSRQAGEAGVAGSVRNMADGSVEAVLEGPLEAVDQVVDWMRSGPRRAVVTSVEVTEEDPLGESGFSVD